LIPSSEDRYRRRIEKGDRNGGREIIEEGLMAKQNAGISRRDFLMRGAAG